MWTGKPFRNRTLPSPDECLLSLAFRTKRFSSAPIRIFLSFLLHHYITLFLSPFVLMIASALYIIFLTICACYFNNDVSAASSDFDVCDPQKALAQAVEYRAGLREEMERWMGEHKLNCWMIPACPVLPFEVPNSLNLLTFWSKNSHGKQGRGAGGDTCSSSVLGKGLAPV
jgi:hypothetical protein